LSLKSSSENIAIFSIDDPDLSPVLPSSLIGISSRISETIPISEYLNQILVKQNIFASDQWLDLFTDIERREIELLLSTAIQKGKSFAYLILIKRDDPISPMTRILRTAIFITKTNGGYIIGIPTISENLSFASQYRFDDWALYRIPKIYPSRKQNLKLKSNAVNLSMYSESNQNRTLYYPQILIFNDANLLPTRIISKVPDEDDEIQSGTKEERVKARLLLLDDLKKQSLINEEEYQSKKTEILKDL